MLVQPAYCKPQSYVFSPFVSYQTDTWTVISVRLHQSRQIREHLVQPVCNNTYPSVLTDYFSIESRRAYTWLNFTACKKWQIFTMCSLCRCHKFAVKIKHECFVLRSIDPRYCQNRFLTLDVNPINLSVCPFCSFIKERMGIFFTKRKKLSYQMCYFNHLSTSVVITLEITVVYFRLNYVRNNCCQAENMMSYPITVFTPIRDLFCLFIY